MLEKDKWNPAQSACLSVPDKVAPLPVDPRKVRNLFWHGTLFGFRFDPVWGEGDFELESIEFYAAPPHKVMELNGEITDMAFLPYEENGVYYIPFDTKSKLKRLANMYYEWDKSTEMLTIYGEKTAVFIKDCDIVRIDGKDVKLKKPLTFVDGLPHIEALILADILGMTFEVEGDVVRMKLV